MCCEYKNNILKVVISIFVFVIIAILIIFLNNNYKKTNILVAISEKGDNPTLGTTTIIFSKNKIIDGTAISHQLNSDEININENGIYQVSYQLYGVQNVTGTFNFNAVIVVNNVANNDTFNESPVIRNSTSNRMTLTSTVILKLQAGDILKLNGVSIEDIEYEKARIDIEKIG
mgnify:CR=1 FL=1